MTDQPRCASIDYVDANIVALGAELGRKLDAIEQKRDRRYTSIKEDLRRQSDDIVELQETVDGHTTTLEEHGRKLDQIVDDHGRKLDRILGLLEAA